MTRTIIGSLALVLMLRLFFKQSGGYMAIKQLVVSDIGGAELEEGKIAKIRVSGHPVLGERIVELDAGFDEVEKFEASANDFVYLEVEVPGSRPKEVVLAVRAFEKVFGSNANVKSILEGAREMSSHPEPEPQTRRRRQRSASNGAAPTAPKRDYTDIENIGLEHRGRVTEREAELVRNNLDRANINRARENQAPIDPNDPKMKKRYGF